MKLNANAALSLKKRQLMGGRVLEQGWSLTEAPAAAEVSERTCSKWVASYRAEGELGLVDRSSAPGAIPHRTCEERVQVIAALGRLRMSGAEIAFCLGMALSTVSAVLTLRTRPYRPRTNGKPERFIRTLLGGWAYGATCATSAERTAALEGWPWTYNHRRPHGALSHRPPIVRLGEPNNLAGSYI